MIKKLFLIIFSCIYIFSADNVSSDSFSVEILSTRNVKNVPSHIIRQAFLGGDNPVFIMDKGLYRLVVGPFSTKEQADQKSQQLSDIFGRDMFVVNIPASRYISAIKLRKPESNIESMDNNEHLGFLEKQRAKVINKYDIDPFGKVKQSPIQQGRVQQYSQNILSIPVNKPQQDTSGLILSVASTSSQHEFAVNGKKIEGSFSYGAKVGYRINDNTLLMLSYFQPETKTTTVYLRDAQQAKLIDIYSYLTNFGIKYRYFIPSFPSFFAALHFGTSFTKQDITSEIPLNFGTSYKYTGWYLSAYTGMGMGIRINRSLTFGIDSTAFMTKNTITTATSFYIQYAF